MSEAIKCRNRVLKYLQGNVLDIGVDDDKVVPWAIGLDLRRITNDVNLVGDATNLYWFKDNVFDAVFSSHCLEDIVDTESVLREWTRIIKPLGFLILYLPHKNFYPNIGYPFANLGHKYDFLPDDIINIVLKFPFMKLVYSTVYSPPNGIYSYENHAKIEYSFEQVFQKGVWNGTIT